MYTNIYESRKAKMTYNLKKGEFEYGFPCQLACIFPLHM
jgi:hypothetical protein